MTKSIICYRSWVVLKRWKEAT